MKTKRSPHAALLRSRFVRTLPLALFSALIFAAGCKSASQYVSPRVEGRVVDAQSRQPVKDVLVARYNANQEFKPSTPPKGGQLMEQNPGVRTDVNGSFELDNVRDVALLRQVGWYSVTISLERAGYIRNVSTYTISDATNTPSGEPLIRTGDILLVPNSE